MAHLIDLIVYRRIFLDIGIGRRNVRLGLIVIVVTHKVANFIRGKELLEFSVKLRSERLIGRDNKGWPIRLRDEIRDSKCLS